MLRMKTKPDPTPKPKPLGESWRLSTGNRKPPQITLPRVRALETPEPNEKDGPQAAPRPSPTSTRGLA